MQMNVSGTINVVIGLDEHSDQLKLILGNLPISIGKIFELIFKLWELRAKYPDEYVDEMFSLVTAELSESPVLQQHLREANNVNGMYLSTHDAVDRLMNVSVGKINAAIMLLDRPLTALLKPFMDQYKTSIEDVVLIHSNYGVSINVRLSGYANIAPVAMHMYSAYDSWRNQKVVSGYPAEQY